MQFFVLILILYQFSVSFGKNDGELKTVEVFGNEDPFSIKLGKQKYVIVNLKKVLPVNRAEGNDVGDAFVGILHTEMKCVEIISEEPLPYLRGDGFYNKIEIKYDITEGQFRTLVQDNPLVIVKFNVKTAAATKSRFKYFNICGVSLFSNLQKDENVEVLVKENILKPQSKDSVSGYVPIPDVRCHGNIPFTNVPGNDIPYFREIQSNPRLARFGLTSSSQVNDVPENDRIIPKNPKRPLLGFGSNPSLKSLLVDEPECTIESLRTSIQTAIELEWATLPLYLTAYYSIKPGQNQDISGIIDGIAVQEMLHFAQASNLLIAVGGVPVIDKTTAPSYPRTGLPGGVLQNLEIPLTKLTKQQTYDTFMGVEIPNNSSAVWPPLINDLYTIGAFYQKEILGCIQELGESAFENPSGDQLVYTFSPSRGTLYQVHNVSIAELAIEEIVGQGEGESPINPDQVGIEGDEYAHFYQYEEIFCGNKLTKKDGSNYYAYDGDPIEFDDNGVYNMVPNPNKHTITPGAASEECFSLASDFNAAYVDMIECLAEVFIDVQNPNCTINEAVGLMVVDVANAAHEIFKVPFSSTSQYTCGPVWDMDFQAGS